MADRDGGRCFVVVITAREGRGLCDVIPGAGPAGRWAGRQQSQPSLKGPGAGPAICPALCRPLWRHLWATPPTGASLAGGVASPTRPRPSHSPLQSSPWSEAVGGDVMGRVSR